MKYIQMIKTRITIGAGEVDKINKSITNAGNDITSIIKTAAQVISGLVGTVAGLALLIVCVKTGFKSWKGNDSAWDEAGNTIAVCVVLISFSVAVFAAFF